ncbi:MAG: arylsulfatase [Actinomycetota bacterium]
MTNTPPVREYDPSEPFPGVIGRTLDESTPAWPAPQRAPDGSPNVVVVLWDDVGFGQFSAFGGLCETPTLDRLADSGLRYSNFHTTALCTPTRGSLMTGRNHHSIGMSAITETSLGYPAHNCFVGREHGFMSEVLLDAGYNTFAVGKWHLTPPTESTTAGPFHRWPLGRGFERFYGFMAGSTDHWHPDLTHDNQPVPAPGRPEDGYHLNIDLADRAIGFIQDAHVHAPDKPFFLYYALGAGHSPHHVEPEWIEKYRGRFDGGWDEYRAVTVERQRRMGLVADHAQLAERDPDVPAWDSLSDDAKRMYARQMEVYAAFIEQSDHHLGRVIDFIDRLGELENTLVVVFSDNGASAEGGVHGNFNEVLFFNGVEETLEMNLEHFDEWGGPETYPHYSWGWTSAGNTPFRRWKRETYRGGVTDPLIVSWPTRISEPGVRTQWTHVTDLLPTILDAAGLERPSAIGGVEQSPMHGVSFAASFNDAAVESAHRTQYFEMFGSRSIYHDGWKANCPFPGPSFVEAAEEGRRFGMALTREILDDLDRSGWELYDLTTDPTETVDLADAEPKRLREMIDRWYDEAERHGVFPLASAGASRLRARRPAIGGNATRQTWYQNASPVYFGAAPRVYNRPYSITADLTGLTTEHEGLLVHHGSRHGGYALYIEDRRLHYVLNYLHLDRFRVSTPDPLPTGDVQVRYQFDPTGPPDFARGRGPGGRCTLVVDGQLAAATEIPYSPPNRFGPVGFSCGYAAFDTCAPDLFDAPFRFTGTFDRVVFDLSGDLVTFDDAEMRRLMVEQ